MGGERFRIACTSWRFKLAIAVMIAEAVFLFAAPLGFAPPAQALPSFARQTGQPCGTCHTDFPALTPYGRRFKLLGYTVQGNRVKMCVTKD
jgi:hypothetical protein